MKAAKTFTQLLCPLFIGLIIGSAIAKNSTLLIWSIILLMLDIIIGITLQHSLDKASYNYHSIKNDSTDVYREIEKIFNDITQKHRSNASSDEDYEYDLDEIDEDKDNEFSRRFNIAYLDLKSNQGSRYVTFNNIRTDKSGAFLIDLCEHIPHAPALHTLFRLYEIFAENLNGCPTIVYKFMYRQNSICENVYIFLVLTKESEIRFFTVETHITKFFLCEYYDCRHLNYGEVSLENIQTKITKLLD